jgi:phosphatidylinositol alpha 1,6-mannosyltransferase
VVRLPGRSGSMFGSSLGSVREAVVESRPDVLHCHTSLVSPLAVTAIGFGVRAGIPTVITAHSTWGPSIRAVYRWADGFSGWSRWPVVWTTVSTSCAEAMRPLLPTGHPVLVPNAIDVAYWSAARQGAASSGVGVHVVAVGRLAARKRPRDLLHVLSRARERLPASIGLRATIVGDGPQRGRMVHDLARWGMSEWVGLVGALSPSEVRGVVSGADVFLAPATLESFGVAALEARTAGVPVLARVGTGIADFVRHGREGLLASSRTELVDGLVRLALDPDLRSSIARHNLRVVPWCYDWSALLPVVDRCYERARSFTACPTLRRGPAVGGWTTTLVPPDLRARSRRRG